jgi:16S rRNA (cytosine967-C5)-methyltransferase
MSSGRAGQIQRRQCLAALDRVILKRESLTVALAEETSHLPAREAAWSRALAYATVRWYIRLGAIVDGMLEHPLKPRDALVRVLLCQGLAEILHFGTPDHAAVRETAELTRIINRPGAVGLVNALLRRVVRERAELTAAMDRNPVQRYACPSWLVSGIRSAFPGHWEAVLQASVEPAPMTLRVNLARTDRTTWLHRLRHAGLSGSPHPLVPSAVTLAEPVDVEHLPGFVEGEVSVQDAAAQWAALLLSPQPGERVLDACAAPGGKTGHLLEMTGGNLDLTALDIDAQRLEGVRENLRRLGYQARLQVGDLAEAESRQRDEPFDAILLDVPCSATGVIRRHPDIKLLRRAGDVSDLAQRQAQLLATAWKRLRPGGRLLYATCSLLAEENEQIVAPWVTRTPDARALALDFPGGIDRAVGRAIALGTEGMDGFYYALLVREA